MAADAFHPVNSSFGGIQAAFGGFEAGVADHTGRTAHQCNRRMPRLLEAAQCQYGQQVSDVQAIGGRVEAAIKEKFCTFNKASKA